MLIARALPIMRVYIKPGGQRGYSGAGVPGNLAPPQNMAPPSEIWPPRKHSLLHRYNLGNCEASSKNKTLKVFVSIYS